jgi:hypothetical protein
MSDEELEQSTSVHEHITTTDAVWPSQVKTAQEISDILGIPVERLTSLADAHYCPHWRIDGGPPMFQLPEVKRWLARNLVTRIDGHQLPIQYRVMLDPPAATDAPAAIRDIPNLRQVVEYPPGVYFLVHGTEVVYVGQSTSPIARVINHRNNKVFERAFMVPVPRELLDEVEGALIRFFKPRMNGADHVGDLAHDRRVLQECGLIPEDEISAEIQFTAVPDIPREAITQI